jgi:membrane protein implicated in regulation of membrane protease activity
MKPADWIALLPAVNNGWAFAAFVVVVVVSLYFGRRDGP